MHRFFRLAYDYARNHKYDPGLEYRLCSVIVRGGSVLSVGFNNRSWSGITEYYRTNPFCCTTHAEIDAILSKRKKIRFEGSKIYTVRLKVDGSVGNAKPCEMCQHVLFNYGVKKAYFTTDEFPFMDSMKVKNPALG